MASIPRALFVGIVVLTAWVFPGCFRRPLLPPTHDTPPQILVPSGRAGVDDGRARFREIWCAVRADHGTTLPDDRPCEDVLLRFAGEAKPTGRPVMLSPGRRHLVVVAVPGIYAECVQDVSRPFSDALAHLGTHGYRTDTIMVSGRSGTKSNGETIFEKINAMALETDERVLLVAHSKGAVDALQALVDHPHMASRIAALVSVAGAINGSPLADGLRTVYRTMLRQLPKATCPPGDEGGLDSLRRATRMEFLAQHTLPAVPYFSVAAIADDRDVSRLLRTAYARLADIDPRNDGQVLWTDAIIPGATLLGYVKADHWAVAMPFRETSPALAALIDHNAFPREVLLESIVRMVEEALATRTAPIASLRERAMLTVIPPRGEPP